MSLEIPTEVSICFPPNYSDSINRQAARSSKPCLLVQNLLNKVAKTVVCYFSPKQAIRPESFRETCIEVISKSYDVFLLKCWKIKSIFKTSIPIDERNSYIEALSILEKVVKDNNTKLSDGEKV